jgi:hypothetical protein
VTIVAAGDDDELDFKASGAPRLVCGRQLDRQESAVSKMLTLVAKKHDMGSRATGGVLNFKLETVRAIQC